MNDCFLGLEIPLTFVTTLNVAFFSSVSELVTVTRSSSELGVVGLKETINSLHDYNKIMCKRTM